MNGVAASLEGRFHAAMLRRSLLVLAPIALLTLAGKIVAKHLDERSGADE